MPSQGLMKWLRRRYSNSKRNPIPNSPNPEPAWPSKAEFGATHVHSLSWADVLTVHEELLSLWTCFLDHIYFHPAQKASLAQGIYSQISWKTNSPYSFPGPVASDIEHDWLFYVKAYRHCLGQLIDIFQLRGEILGLYDSRPEAPVSLITSQLVVPHPKFRTDEIFEQLRQKVAVMACLVNGMVYIPPEFQPKGRVLQPPLGEVVDVYTFAGMGKGTAAAIRPRILRDEIWASRVCYLAGLGRIK
ncbi:hypothetical protein EV426DRAFT_705128 [Tirmania nivea]|nr:hypothetical protein EV426DRAFT_705128 [Tirmania nivea]